MVGADFWVAVAMLLYFLVVISVGFVYAKRSNSSSEEYFLGGRKLGPWLTALSAEASDMSGWLLMGLPGVAYFLGASDAMWTAIGLAIGTYLNWKFIAARLRKYSEVANNAITLPDYFSNRFHDSKSILMTIAALLILVFFSIYAGSCFVTCGKLFSTLFGAPYISMMLVGAIFVLVYTILGGFLAESASDFMQAIVMIVALTVIVVISTVNAGGIGTVMENAEIVVQHVPYMVKCNQCGTEFHLEVMEPEKWACPNCQAYKDYELVSGNEFYISKMAATRKKDPAAQKEGTQE